MAKKTKSIEEMLEEIEAIIADLEGEETSLEQSFKLYEDGMKIVKQVSEKMDKVEKDLIILERSEDVL